MLNYTVRHYLLICNKQTNEVESREFSSLREASTEYTHMESRYTLDPNVEVLLAAADSVDTLPSYLGGVEYRIREL